MRTLPERPSLEQLKKQAKSLLRAARAQDKAALHRFRLLPAFESTAASELAATELALHDAQSVIAREHGFPSWNALREEVEVRALSFDAALDEFVRCATGGRHDRAERLLALHPSIATATLQTALVLGDVSGVEARLRECPELAAQPAGVQQWEPLLYVCHSCMHRSVAARADGFVAIARRLCELGANPNAEYRWNWHPELPRTALWASVCEVRHLPLAEVLLEAGANPTDGVTAHIAGSFGNVVALDLLHRFGFDVNGIPGGVPPLVYIMFWSDDPTGPRWLLEHGADPNLAWGDAGEAPLHVAARRWDVPMAELLLQHGADPMRRRADGRIAHTVAELYGNAQIAELLVAHGARSELSPVERFISACARGDRASAENMLASQPSLRKELRVEHHLMLHRPAESGNTAALEAMLACGFDPNARDKDGVTALHRAAMAGHPGATRVLLAFDADVNALDGTFSASPLVWAAEGRAHPRSEADHVGVARLLIEAGSALDWTAPEGAPGAERTDEALLELLRAAAIRDEAAGSPGRK